MMHRDQTDVAASAQNENHGRVMMICVCDDEGIWAGGVPGGPDGSRAIGLGIGTIPRPREGFFSPASRFASMLS